MVGSPLSAIPPSGTILHIKNFVGVGHPPTNKYAYVLGETQDGGVLFFLISTQDYSQTQLGRETIFVPSGICNGLNSPEGCWIQCFHQVEFWGAAEFWTGRQSGRVTLEGQLPRSFLTRVREVVESSYVLKMREITECTTVIDAVLASPSQTQK
jgi:hypothetical protein